LAFKCNDWLDFEYKIPTCGYRNFSLSVYLAKTNRLKKSNPD
jgi:hypothetical protein